MTEMIDAILPFGTIGESSMASEEDNFVTRSGIPVPRVPNQQTLDESSSSELHTIPGMPPYTRGIHQSMYRGRKWTMRQYAGFSSAGETNSRFKSLLDKGQSGLSVAFDLPTQLGLDSDDPMSLGEVGKVGVAIDSIHDMRLLFDGINTSEVSTSMTINAPATILLAMYVAVAEENGADISQIRGTIQNDILKEYIARGTYVFPPEQSMRLITDLMAWCKTNIPSWNTISISGYHIREAGATAVQELAFTLSNALAYVEAAVDSGLAVDDFAPRLSFFFGCHNDLFEEIPQSIGYLTNLNTLNLSMNSLSGQIPDNVGDLTSLETLDLRGNVLSGPIPMSIGDLLNLESLELRVNDISGEIPNSIGNLIQLKYLGLNVVGFLSKGDPIRDDIPKDILGDLDDFDEIVQKHYIDEVYITT
ncbi:MAG: methylmalonyl-CoA mutase family protein, partial [Candidatus Thalassarchaeaceae archaeon]|nr:methylmalonyl-CoA mutase family protein [Candidatus Thalassarchaeaceae archaeon]